MKILITGAAGFIGGHLHSKLTQLGHEVVGIDNFFHPSKNPNNTQIKNFDIRNDIEPFVIWADVVFHLAAQIHVDYSIQHPAETFDINVDATVKLLEACRKHGKKLVFASSSEIYGSSRSNYMGEHHPTLPQSPYAVSKLAGDQLCLVYRDIYKAPISVVRNFNTFGEWQNDTSYGGVIAIFAKKAFNNEPLNIYGDGTQSRDYMYVDDALQGYLMSLTTDFDVLNFGTGSTVSVNQLAETIIKLTGSKSSIIHIEPRPGEVQRLCADITKAKTYGFLPNTNLERDLAKYLNWYKTQI